jgi:hypothetical protein
MTSHQISFRKLTPNPEQMEEKKKKVQERVTGGTGEFSNF